MKIYLDVLFFSNAMITYVFVSLLSRLIHRPTTGKRMLSAVFFGAFSSMIILISPDSFFQSLLLTFVKFAVQYLTVFIAFGKIKRRQRVYYCFILVVINIAFGGVCMLLWEMFGGKAIAVKNYTVYFDVPLWLLVSCIAVTYFALTIYDRIVYFRNSKAESYKAVFTFGDRSVTLPAICDSGDLLIDSFSGEPVVVFCSKRLYTAFDLDDENSFAVSGFRLIPYSTADSSGPMPVTLKGKVTIFDSSGEGKEIRCAAGIINSSSRERAIFNPKLLL